MTFLLQRKNFLRNRCFEWVNINYKSSSKFKMALMGLPQDGTTQQPESCFLVLEGLHLHQNYISRLISSSLLVKTIYITVGIYRWLEDLHTYNFSFLAEECMTLKSLIELALGNISEDLVLSFICGAVWDSGRQDRKMKEEKYVTAI